MDCTHENCLCTSEVGITRDGRDYCSDHCAEVVAAARHENGCLCGHAGCSSAGSGTSLE